jgi:hypothetical protein
MDIIIVIQINIYFMEGIRKFIMFSLVMIGLSSCGALKGGKGKCECEEWGRRECEKTDSV